MMHDDVRRLTNILERKWEDRDQEKRRESIRRELDVDEDIPASVFWCSRCSCEFAPKIVYKADEDDWNTGGRFRYWKARHRCGEWAKRLITDKLKDPFWSLSPTVKRERARFKKDMLQPHESGYDMLYGKKNQNQ